MTQASLFPVSELEPAAPVPRRRLARLKSLLLAFDAGDFLRALAPEHLDLA